MQFYVQAFGRDAFHCNVDGTHKLSWHGWPLIGFGSHKTYLNADKKPAHHFVPWLFAMSKEEAHLQTAI